MVNQFAVLWKLLVLVALTLGTALSVAADAEDSLPSLEFLEYLGEWQDEAGDLIDPLLLSESQELNDVADSEGESQ